MYYTKAFKQKVIVYMQKKKKKHCFNAKTHPAVNFPQEDNLINIL